MITAFRVLVLVANIAWFGAGFSFFALRPRRALALLVPRSSREEGSARTLEASLPFLGGMNLAFATLSAATLSAIVFAHGGTASLWPVFLSSSVAHATQLACNVPHARRGGRAGGAPWDVLRGTMLFIFVVDGACALLNAAAALVA